MNEIKDFENKAPNGLNGCIMLIHLGTAPERTDKFYNRLNDLLSYLKKKRIFYRTILMEIAYKPYLNKVTLVESIVKQ